MIYRSLRQLLFKLDPETAHRLAIGALRFIQQTELCLEMARDAYPVREAPLEVAGLKFRNPVGLAAGFDKDAEVLPALASLGFGFIELGTLTRRAQPGNPKPRVFRYPERRALVNRLGFNNRGVEDAARRLEKLPKLSIPVGVNVGKSFSTPLEDAPAEYAACVDILHPFADYVTLNISSPNTADLRRLHEPDRLKALLDAVSAVLSKKGAKPLFLKVSPDASKEDYRDVSRIALDRGIGLIATNTTVSRQTTDALEAGGLSGEPLRARATASLRLLRELTGGKVPLIGVGGIFGPEDAKEKLNAGASLIQLYTGFIYEGPSLIGRIVESLAQEKRSNAAQSQEAPR